MTIKHKLDVLVLLAKRLNDLHITWNIGSSTMLYLRGIVDHFNDIDIMIKEEDAYLVVETLLSMGVLQDQKASDRYQTTNFYEFVVEDVDIDVIAGYKIVSDGVVHYFPLEEKHIDTYVMMNDTSIPLASMHDWLLYYRLMKRKDKIEIIENHLKRST